MKVLFSASNRRSSEILHSRILKELEKEFELRTCGYLNNTKLSKNVDYILDPLLINTNYRTKLDSCL